MKSRDHGFTGNQQAEYDSLSSRGRTMYDVVRWTEDETHARAFTRALNEHGLKSAELRRVEELFEK